jgi:hypothetical protein
VKRATDLRRLERWRLIATNDELKLREPWRVLTNVKYTDSPLRLSVLQRYRIRDRLFAGCCVLYPRRHGERAWTQS